MIKIARQDWAKFVRDNNPEVFNEEQINAWIESNRDLLVKAEGETLSPQDNQFVEDFRTEISHFTKVEVLRPNEDKLQKALVHEIFYIREQQVEWDEEIIKSEDGQEFTFGTYRETSLNNKLGRVGNLIEKGKRGQLGEIREWKGGKYKKTAQGWIPVSEGKKESKKETAGDEGGNSNESKRFNHEGITWEVVKRGETESKVRAVTASEKGKEKVIDNKIIDGNKNESNQPKGEVKNNKSEYFIQYKDKWGEIYQKPFIATSIQEAIKMAKEQKIGSDIGPSKIKDKTGREEEDEYIKEHS